MRGPFAYQPNHHPMQISYQSDGTVGIVSKGKSVHLGSVTKIEDYTIPGAGEYDVAAVQCEVHALPGGLAYFFHVEDITITFLTSLLPEVTSLDEASSTDILVVDLRSDATADQFKSILKRLEPSYVMLMGSGATPELAQALGLPPFEGSALKITRTSLPEEGTFLLNLP